MMLLSAACSLLALSPGGGPPPVERAPNVILIMADDLGWGELGCYGQTKIRTPHLDRLASDGMRFTEHYSGSPVCAPSRCVLLTGRHPGHAFVRGNKEVGSWGPDEPEGQLPLPAGEVTLAEHLVTAGYRCGAFGKWGLGGPGSSGHPCFQGFERFYGYLCQRVAHNYYPTHLWSNHDVDVLDGNRWFSAHQKLADAPADAQGYAQFAGARYAPDEILDAALEFVRARADEPFFLYYPTPVPHVALQVPKDSLNEYPADWDAAPYLGERGYLPHPRPRAAYAAMVTRMDRDIGRILALVDELELREDTIVLFTSDNGPTFNGGTDSDFFASAAGFRGLKCSVYEGGIRVPLIVRWPGRIAAAAVSAHTSAFQDLLPTILELAGAAPAQGLDGISMADSLLGRAEQQERHAFLYWEYPERGGSMALRAGRWKLVRHGLRKGPARTELFDLEADPAEASDLAAERPEIVEALMEQAQAARWPSADFPLPLLDEGR